MDAQGIELFCRFASGLGSRSARDSSPSVLLGRCGSLMEAGVAIRIGLRSGGSRNGVSADVSFARHGVLFLGEITRREARRSQSSVSD